MQATSRSHCPILLILGVAAALLVAESNCFSPHQSVQQIIDKDLGASEAILSMIVNQVAVLKLLNESSTFCSLHERLNQNIDLDVKIEEAKKQLQLAKEEALLELKNMTMAAMNELKATNEEARVALTEMKEMAANVSRQPTTTRRKCESDWTKYQSSCYKVFKTQVNNAVARESCRNQDAHLATIGSEEVNNLVDGLISQDTYIGLDDTAEDGVYVWQDGSPFSYSNWMDGEPNQGQVCAVMHPESYWRDRECGATHHYVCERRLQ